MLISLTKVNIINFDYDHNILKMTSTDEMICEITMKQDTIRIITDEIFRIVIFKLIII